MEAKLKYYLQIADNALILSHRLSENCSKGPFLEEDLANTNVALDLIGIAESIYGEVAKQENKGRSGDDIVYRRKETEFLNVILVEMPNEDFAHIMVRQFFTDVFQLNLFSELRNSKDEFLMGIAHKSLKEVMYHLKRSSEWMYRFGQGTDEAKERVQKAINKYWKYTHEFFLENSIDAEMLKAGFGADLSIIQKNWQAKVEEIFEMSNLSNPVTDFSIEGGKNGLHSEHLGYILTEMQFLPSKYPDAIW